MEAPAFNAELVDSESIDFIEAQSQRNFEFRLESMKLLTGEAMTTLNWLFALTITPAGYVFSRISDIPWWIATPATLCSFSAGITAVYLFENALKIKSILPGGNEPKNILTTEVLEADLKMVRVAEIANLQERITIISGHNERAGKAINIARRALVGITAISIALLGYLYFAANG